MIRRPFCRSCKNAFGDLRLTSALILAGCLFSTHTHRQAFAAFGATAS